MDGFGEATRTIGDGWHGAAAAAAAQAPAALAEWGEELAAAAAGTANSMRAAADGAERAQRQIPEPTELDWNAALSGVLDKLLAPSAADRSAMATTGGAAPDGLDAGQAFAADQAADAQARRVLDQTFSPSYESAGSAVPAFSPPAAAIATPAASSSGPISGEASTGAAIGARHSGHASPAAASADDGGSSSGADDGSASAAYRDGSAVSDVEPVVVEASAAPLSASSTPIAGTPLGTPLSTALSCSEVEPPAALFGATPGETPSGGRAPGGDLRGSLPGGDPGRPMPPGPGARPAPPTAPPAAPSTTAGAGRLALTATCLPRSRSAASGGAGTGRSAGPMAPARSTTRSPVRTSRTTAFAPTPPTIRARNPSLISALTIPPSSRRPTVARVQAPTPNPRA